MDICNNFSKDELTPHNPHIDPHSKKSGIPGKGPVHI